MAAHVEEHMSDDDRPRPVRFSIFGQIQQRRLPYTSLPMKAEHSDNEEHYGDDNDEDQPLDFSSKKESVIDSNPMDLVKTSARFDTWQPGSHSSESGVSDLCSNSPQSDREAHLHSAPSPPPLSVNPLVQQLQRQSTSPINAMYNPLSALQPPSPVASLSIGKSMDPTITAATSQLLSNLAAVTNGGKGSKNTRPFKAYPKDPLNLPLGLYGLPLSGTGGNEGMSQASNEAYSEFRRQMLAQVQAAKSKRTSKTSTCSGTGSNPSNSRPNSVNDHNENSHDNSIPETTIQGTVSVTDLRISGQDDDTGHKSPQSGDYSVHTSGCSSISATVSVPSTTTSTPTSGKKRGRSGDEIKDDAYWERRRKNNEAAKRSRDARRAKEDEIAIRAAFLEQENLKLRFEVAALKSETAKLRCMIYNS